VSLAVSLRRLTDIQIRNLPPPDKGQKVYCEPSGLCVRVSQGGSKSFVFQVGKAGKRIELGRYPLWASRRRGGLPLGLPRAPQRL